MTDNIAQKLDKAYEALLEHTHESEDIEQALDLVCEARQALSTQNVTIHGTLPSGKGFEAPAITHVTREELIAHCSYEMWDIIVSMADYADIEMAAPYDDPDDITLERVMTAAVNEFARVLEESGVHLADNGDDA